MSDFSMRKYAARNNKIIIERKRVGDQLDYDCMKAE